MSEKINSELNTEDTLETAAEETENTENAVEAETSAEDIEESVTADDATAEAENAVETEAETSDADVETDSAGSPALSDDALDINTITEEAQPAKKKSFLQVPVIISLCIVLAAILGFLCYYAFFLKEPENVMWSNEVQDTTYYYEFKNDGSFKAYVGTIEVTNSYQKNKSEEGNTLTVGTTIGSFYQSAPADYTISGSRLFGNQEMTCTYSEDYEFTLKQAKRENGTLDLPDNFTPDENLVGSWVFKYMGYDIYKVTFNKDGSMVLEFVQDGLKYNGIYTLEDGTVNFTYISNESVTVPVEYSVDGDELSFLGYNFVREGSEAANATSDQQLVAPEE